MAVQRRMAACTWDVVQRRIAAAAARTGGEGAAPPLSAANLGSGARRGWLCRATAVAPIPPPMCPPDSPGTLCRAMADATEAPTRAPRSAPTNVATPSGRLCSAMAAAVTAPARARRVDGRRRCEDGGSAVGGWGWHHACRWLAAPRPRRSLPRAARRGRKPGPPTQRALMRSRSCVWPSLLSSATSSAAPGGRPAAPPPLVPPIAGLAALLPSSASTSSSNASMELALLGLPGSSPTPL